MFVYKRLASFRVSQSVVLVIMTDFQLTINKNYALKFHKRKQTEELSKCKVV